MYFIIESCSQKLRQLNLGLPSLQISVVSSSCIHGQSFYALWPSIFSLLGFTRMRYTNWGLVMLMDSQEEDGWHRDSRSAEHTCSKSFGCRLRNSVISQRWSYTFLVQPLHEGTDQWTCSNGHVLCVDQPWKEINTPLSAEYLPRKFKDCRNAKSLQCSVHNEPLSILTGNEDKARNKTPAEELIQSLLKSVAALLRTRARALLGR